MLTIAIDICTIGGTNVVAARQGAQAMSMLVIAPIVAGVVYVVTPGPATLAVVGLTAERGRAIAARFYLGHLVGDVAWAILALAAIVGASKLGPDLFACLGLACGLYLAWLGLKALLAHGSSGAAVAVGAAAPLRTGLVFGLTNPKAYPFSLAMFTALAVDAARDFGLADGAVLLFGVVIGFVIGDVITLAWAGLPPVRAGYARFRPFIVRLMGVLFVAFGVKTVWDACAIWRAR
ncbi:MAG: LysE family transporter [Ancalomicrobiaceae bacterium]|nr:LysE family transporter [Ancalomicrobiaceae bacterium]